MAKRSRKTPQLVSVNRGFMIIGFLGVLAMIAYFYWDKEHRRAKALINTQQIQN